MSDEGIGLTPAEAEVLAKRIIARRVADVEDWLMWEDYPELGEYTFERLVAAVVNEGEALNRRSNLYDQQTDIDSQLLLELANP